MSTTQNVVVVVVVVLNVVVVVVVVVVVAGSGPTHFREHRDNSFKQLTRYDEIGCGGQAQRLEGVQDRRTFQGRTPRDAVETAGIPTRLAAAFRDVERDGQGGATELIRQVADSSGNPASQCRGMTKERDCTAIDVESLKSEHIQLSPPGRSSFPEEVWPWQ